MRPIRRWLLGSGLLAAVVVAAVALHAHTVPPAGAVPRPGAWPRVALPLSAYIPNDDQRDLLYRAGQALIERCLARFGLRYEGPSAMPAGYPATLSQLYYLDASEARATGFHTNVAAPAATGTPPMPTTQAVLIGWQRQSAPGSPPMAAAVPVVRELGGQPVPANGCRGEAADWLAAGAPKLPVPPEVKCAYACGDLSAMVAANEVTSLQQLAQDRLAADPAYAALQTDWSRCMAGRGHRYATPRAAWTDPRWNTDRPSQSEIAVAVQYAGCQQAVNYLDRLTHLETTYELQIIGVHRAELDPIAANLAVRLHNAHALLTETGPVGPGRTPL